jgi:hypothetical protein
MKANRELTQYQTCYQCGFENLNTATHCLACKVKLKPLLPYKQALVETLHSSKFSSRTPWAISGILAVILTGVNVYCVSTSTSCYRDSIPTNAQK